MSAKGKRCPVCGNLIAETVQICPYCGSQPQSNTGKQCPGCGQDITDDAEICPVCGYDNAGGGQRRKKRKTFVIILAVLFCIAAGAAVLTHQYRVPEETAAGSTNQSKSAQETGRQEPDKKMDISEVSLEDADMLYEQGKELISDDAGLADGMRMLADAIGLYAEQAAQAGDISIVSDRVVEAYEIYMSAVRRHKDMLCKQELSGDIYHQIVMEYDDAAALGDRLLESGYEVNAASVREDKEEFETGYREEVILLFNTFTEREMWSRTEAWKLMAATVDNMFDPADLDDPLRLRYAYAYSWWIQREIETELAGGLMTKKKAAITIGESMEQMDYNPMMLFYYITYMKDAGENCTQAEAAYDDVVEHIYETQGIWIGEDMDLARFWYFNDFDAFSVDETNGVTRENRQWIRDRMSQVTFLTQ